MMHPPISSPCVWIPPIKLEFSTSEWLSEIDNVYRFARQIMSLFLDYLGTNASQIYLTYQELAQETRSHFGSLLSSAINTHLDINLQHSFEEFLDRLSPLQTSTGWTICFQAEVKQNFSLYKEKFREYMDYLFRNFTYLRTIAESNQKF